jgi:hypothetical protein
VYLIIIMNPPPLEGFAGLIDATSYSYVGAAAAAAIIGRDWAPLGVTVISPNTTAAEMANARILFMNIFLPTLNSLAIFILPPFFRLGTRLGRFARATRHEASPYVFRSERRRIPFYFGN